MSPCHDCGGSTCNSCGRDYGEDYYDEGNYNPYEQFDDYSPRSRVEETRRHHCDKDCDCSECKKEKQPAIVKWMEKLIKGAFKDNRSAQQASVIVMGAFFFLCLTLTFYYSSGGSDAAPVNSTASLDQRVTSRTRLYDVHQTESYTFKYEKPTFNPELEPEAVPDLPQEGFFSALFCHSRKKAVWCR